VSWIDLAPAKKSRSASAKTGASITCSRPGRFSQRIGIIVRELPTWWKRGQSVRCLLGAAENKGRLRITPGGPFEIGSATTGQAKHSSQPRLLIPLFEGVSSPGVPSQPVQYDYHDDWIEIDLPSWAIPPEKPQPSTKTADAVHAPKVAGQSKAVPSGAAFRTAATHGRAPAGIAGGR